MPDPAPIDSPSLRAHKRQTFWQILLPMLLVVLAGLAAAGLTIAAGLANASATRLWADISTIWLIAPLLLLALILLAALVAMIFGVAKLIQVTPRVTSQVQAVAGNIAAGTQKVAGWVMKPFLWIRQAGTAVDALIERALGTIRRGGKE